MSKEHILSEIKRTARANGGAPLGWRRFEDETGIRHVDWYGRHWVRWGDAVREAGFEPNRMTVAFKDEFLLEKLALLTRRLKHVPVAGELLLAARSDPALPSEAVFRRLGRKSQRVSRMIAFCEANPEYNDVAPFGNKLRSQRHPISRKSISVLEVSAMSICFGMVRDGNIKSVGLLSLYAEKANLKPNFQRSCRRFIT